jgi:hypothetical protein
VDTSGNAYVTGETSSSAFTGGSNNGGTNNSWKGGGDAFVARVIGITPGDFNDDGIMNSLDIPDFKSALADTQSWESATGRSAAALGDFNNDTVFNSLDIAAFKAALSGSAMMAAASAPLVEQTNFVATTRIAPAVSPTTLAVRATSSANSTRPAAPDAAAFFLWNELQKRHGRIAMPALQKPSAISRLGGTTPSARMDLRLNLPADTLTSAQTDGDEELIDVMATFVVM